MSVTGFRGVAALSDNVRASLLMVATMAAFAVNDAFVKLATDEISPGQIMMVRGCLAFGMLATIAATRGALRSPRLMFHPAVAGRSLADVAATITFIYALTFLPLANASAIFQAVPLVVTIGAVLFFAERVGWRRWVAIAVGFAGVIVIIRPGSDGFTLASLLVLVSVLFTSARDLTTRAMPRATPTLFVAATTALAVTLTGAAMTFGITGWAPMSGRTLFYILASSVMIAVGYVTIVEAMRLGDTGFVAPFRYSVLVWAFVLGIVVFGEGPGIYEIAGSIIVVGSGLYMIARERRAGRIQAAKAQTH